MKRSLRRTAWITIALVFSAVSATLLWIILPPVITREVPIPGTFITWLQSEHSEEIATRLRDPLEVSLRLLHYGAPEPIDTSGTTIRVDMTDGGERIVTIDVWYVPDDSINRHYSRIRLKRTDSGWIPVEHRFARQGRGVFGWTTGPTD